MHGRGLPEFGQHPGLCYEGGAPHDVVGLGKAGAKQPKPLPQRRLLTG